MGNRKAANGEGTIRKKAVTGKDGKVRTYFEARLTAPDGSRRSVSSTSQTECLEKMRKLRREMESGTYCKPTNITVSEWLDEWLKNYCVTVKPRTLEKYQYVTDTHLKPAIGKIKLDKLSRADVQKMINNLKNKRTGEPLAPKSIKDIHGTIHKALETAVDLEILPRNVADRTKLPKVTQAEINPLTSEEVTRFIEAIQGHRYQDIFMVDLFTGAREGEICGLSWDNVNFKEGTVTIAQQLQIDPKSRKLVIATPKNSKSRTLRPAPAVMQILRDRKIQQLSDKLRAGGEWKNTNNLVFTHEDGRPIHPHSVYDSFKVFAKRINRGDLRFHDLRHTFAVISLQNGDDIRTLQENLGHFTAAFTLNTYCHSTDDMKRQSAERMDKFIKAVAAS